MSTTTILLVDDNIAFAEGLARRLTRRKLKVIIAANKSETLRVMACNDDIEAIIMDDCIPGLEKFEMLKLLRTLYPLIEVIMFTRHTTFESAIEGLRLGAFEYMMKLCDLDYLIERVMAAVEQKRQKEKKIFLAKMKEFLPALIQPRMALNYSCEV